ncbi:DUF4055 domain-containing protein [Pseudomonas aeruginosa]|uniref:DUF4055 domain-containing protein n=1 Tax=Pseudomonas aeruginosa TaxID=287 RepID=UPI001D0A55A0|nr:DUF4055 domain-containing protein [Pseudomonas aeruginosa]MCC0378678.1 DUF4055 domain-containing protein [Pseudomonas aeruginosa]
MSSSNSPDIVLDSVEKMRRDWGLVSDLLGGTDAMRKAGEKHLPKWPKEEKENYQERLQRSTLLPAFSETVKNLAGRVLARPITLGDEVPEDIAGWCNDDIDLMGNNLDVFAGEWFRTGLGYGLCHCLVDYPPSDGVKTIAQEREAGIRPYAVLIRPQQVLGYRYRVDRGRPVLTQFRYMEEIEEEDGEFGSKKVQQVRVLEINRWATYRRDGDDWALHEEGETTLNKIPLVTFYTGQTGVMTARPPLIELAHLNVTHWQSQSDQRNLLHVARVPILVAINAGDAVGPDGSPIPWEMTVGTSSATRINGDGADLKFVEHGGRAMEAGRQDLLDLLEEMRIAGARLLHRDAQAVKTAAQANEEAAEKISALETMGNAFEDAIDQMLQLFADWTNQESGGFATVEGNYDTDYAPEVSLPVLKQMADSNFLSQETLFDEVKRRGVISDSLKWEDEQERILNQAPTI